MSNHFQVVSISLQEANDFVENLHRHHDPVHRDKFRCGAVLDGKLVGVVQIGRPVSRGLDDGQTVEVVRLCTDGTRNACSFLYARAANAAKELGYSRIYTYILESEDGASLKASGWVFDGWTHGGTWDCNVRPRNYTAPTCRKARYVKRFREQNVVYRSEYSESKEHQCELQSKMLIRDFKKSEH